jgi:hypothetical protein
MRRFVLASIAVFALFVGVAEAALRTDGSTPAPSSITSLATQVPASTLDAVGAGKLLAPSQFQVTKLSGAPLTSGGKPELLTFVLAWCPHCAADSWALAIALSRFGTLSGLREIDSGTVFGTKFHAHPSYPHTKGLSFLRASYTSAYLTFHSVILQDVSARTFQRPTHAENKAISAFDPSGGAPVVDVGGAYGFTGSGLSPGALAHQSWSQIAGSLATATSPVAQRIDGLANLFAAAICKTTNNLPATVCTSSGVLAAGAAHLPIAPPPPPPGPAP